MEQILVWNENLWPNPLIGVHACYRLDVPNHQYVSEARGPSHLLLRGCYSKCSLTVNSGKVPVLQTSLGKLTLKRFGITEMQFNQLKLHSYILCIL